MVRNKRALLAATAGLGLAVVLYLWLRGGSASATSPAPTPAASRTEAAPSEVPRIGLDRLQQASTSVGVGQRDIFDFGAPPPPPEPPPPPPTVAVAPTPPPIPTPTPLPPLSVKYIGSMETEEGLKVAFFMTDQKDVVSGQVGEIVMNRFRVVKIGFESVDVQQTGSEQVQRLPLRSN